MGVRKNDLGNPAPPDILKNNCSKKISTWKIVPREIDPPPKKNVSSLSKSYLSPEKTCLLVFIAADIILQFNFFSFLSFL